MANKVIAFEIPFLPSTTNKIGRKHWAVKKRENDTVLSFVASLTRFQRPKTPFKKAVVRLVRHSSSEPDFDGLVSSFKSVLDALVKCGVLEDDRSSNIGQPIYEWEKCKRGAGKVSVMVWEKLDMMTGE